MPAVIPIIAAGAAKIGAITWFQAIMFTGSYYYQSHQARKQERLAKAQMNSLRAAMQNQSHMIKESAGEHQIVYGENVKLSGNICFAHVAPDENGKECLFLSLVLAGHECGDVKHFYVGEEDFSYGECRWSLFTNGGGGWKTPEGHNLEQYFEFGYMDHEGPLWEVSDKWTADHKLEGLTFVHCKLSGEYGKYDNIPDIALMIDGKKVYDPRDEQSKHTENSALIILDYLMDERYGLNILESDIDMQSFINAANICDQIAADGTTRYKTHGVISTSLSHQEVLDLLLDSCGGKLIYSGGIWKLKVGAWEEPTYSFDEDDLRAEVVADGVLSRSEIFNTIRGVYLHETEHCPTDYPTVKSDTHIEEDGEPIPYTLDFQLVHQHEQTQSDYFTY
jgi:hypothetical protein